MLFDGLPRVADGSVLVSRKITQGPDGTSDERGQDARSSFEVLFEQTHLALLAYAVRRVADPADAADVVADAFLVAWRRIDEVPKGPDARPWMFGVARGCLSNYYRGERRRSALAERLRSSLGAIHLDDHPGSDRLVVRDALATLTEGDRELVQLAAWEQLSRAEIALALGCSQAAVRVRLHRARTRLRQALAVAEQPNPGGAPGSGGSPTRPALRLAPSTPAHGSTARSTPRAPQENPCAHS